MGDSSVKYKLPVQKVLINVGQIQNENDTDDWYMVLHQPTRSRIQGGRQGISILKPRHQLILGKVNLNAKKARITQINQLQDQKDAQNCLKSFCSNSVPQQAQNCSKFGLNSVPHESATQLLVNNPDASEDSSLSKLPCNICGREFIRKANIKRHKELVHNVKAPPKVQPFPCQFCKKKFSRQGTLYEHRRRTHPEVLDHISQPIKIKRKKKVWDRKGTRIFVYDDMSETEKNDVLAKLPPRDYISLKYKRKSGEEDSSSDKKVCAEWLIDSLEEAEEDALEWVRSYQQTNQIRFRFVGKTSDAKNIIKNRYACHRNAQKKGPRNRKNTGCPAFLYLRVRHGETSEDQLRCYIILYNRHNHDKEDAAALHKRGSGKTSNPQPKDSPQKILSMSADQFLLREEVVPAEPDTELIDSDANDDKEQINIKHNEQIDHDVETEHHSTLEQFLENLNEVCEIVGNDESVFNLAMRAFNDQYKKIRTHGALLSALQNFGRFNEPVVKKRKTNESRVIAEKTSFWTNQPVI